MLSYFERRFRLEGDTMVTGDAVSGGRTGLSFSCLEGSTNGGMYHYSANLLCVTPRQGLQPSMSELQRANMFEAESPTAERSGAGPPK